MVKTYLKSNFISMQQQYEDYSDADFKIWRELYERQMAIVPKYACTPFLKALDKIGFSREEIPRFEALDKVLMEATGWSITVVKGLIPVEDFFQALAEKKFPASTWLRNEQQLEYIEEPDMFHDIFGHVPLLVNPVYASFIQAYAQMALEYTQNEKAIALLQRLYWFTVEFGLIQEREAVRIYGAGIISSPKESLFSVGGESRKLPFNIDTIFNNPFEKSNIQQEYYVISELEELERAIPEIKKRLDQLIEDGLNDVKPVR
ncbi:hypothetical protein PEPS_10740 [Persicobacter psychrovividus]|uniref:Phenylalanine-4-hydroxylase n=2 Tax=Persicobacter psychrovividus TaxID=387638 RepID=A0ABN6L7J5_9BACT|nr:hypothetical protein PEPS_10740 [Persicobacter psychrovividus]